MNCIELRILAVFAILSVLSGCQTTPESTKGYAAPRPTVHAWSYLREYGNEPEYYATYSYILVGRTDPESEAVGKFYSLIQAVQGSTSSTSEILDGTPRRVTNLFLIPAIKNQSLPDANLAKSYVSALEASHEKFQRPGPFVVTLYEPISAEFSDVKHMLIVDLTDIHEGAFEEVVGVFKGRVMGAPISGIEVLRSFKASLLSFAFMAEDSIRFASIAYGQMRAVFEPE